VACPAAQAEALPLFGHVLAAEHVWLARLEKREPRVAVWPTLSVAECESLAAENGAGYRQYAAELDDARLAEVLDYRTQSGMAMSTAVIDILTHVVIHGAYHRGQVAKMIGKTGVSAPTTDYIAYVRTLAM
ncbi:MAG: DinB family protein, partial [Pirellulales bacterium]